MVSMHRIAPLPLLVILAACEPAPQQGAAADRVNLAEAPSRAASAQPSPDTSAANWRVADDGQAILYGNEDADPWLSLACVLEEPAPQVVIIRHARALPGQEALFPIIGNGINSRFLADAVFDGERWHWEARVAASDPQLDVFSGTRDLIATLPGRGTLEIAGDRLPGDFLDWCRSGGRTAVPENTPEEEQAEDAA